MTKLSKVLLVIISVIVVVMVIGYFIIKTYLTPKMLRNITEKVTSEAIQCPVEIGSVGLKFGFKVGIMIDDVLIKDVNKSKFDTLFYAKGVSLNLRLIPLLSRKIVIGGVDLSGVKIELKRDKKGKVNLPSMISREGKGTGWSFSLSSINVSNGNIHYTDAKNNIELQIKDIRQNITFKGDKIHFSGDNTIYVLKNKNLPEMVVKTSNKVEYDSSEKRIQVKEIKALYDPIVFRISGIVDNMDTPDLNGHLTIGDASKLRGLIPIDSRPAELSGTLESEFSISGTFKRLEINGQCEFKNISIVLKGMNHGVEKVNGSLSFSANEVNDINLRGEIGNAIVTAQGSIKNFKEPEINITTKADGDLEDIESLTDEIKQIDMKGPFTITVTMKGKIKNPSYYGEYNIDNAMINGIGLAKPITNFKINGTIQKDVAKVNRCSGQIGGSDFSFNGHVSNFKKPVVQVNNTSNTIDLNELLPDQKKGKKQDSKPIPLTLKGKTRINTLVGIDMVFKNVNTELSYEGGVIDLKDCSADAFDGNVKFDFYYNANNPEPYRINTHLTKVSTKKILRRFLKFENIEGSLSGVSNFSGKGFGKQEVIANLTASGNLQLNNGAFNNFAFITKLMSWLGIKEYSTVPFSSLVLYYKITKGKAQINDLALSSSTGDLLFNGTIGLNGGIDLKVSATLAKKYSAIVKKYHGDWIFPIDKNGRATIDILAKGTLMSPQFSLDKTRIKDRIKGKVKDEFDKKKKEWENKLKDLLKGKG